VYLLSTLQSMQNVNAGSNNKIHNNFSFFFFNLQRARILATRVT